MISSKEELEMYKKRKVEISFEVVEWVDDDRDDVRNNVDEWLGHLKTLVDCLDYRAEYEVEGADEYGDPIYRKLKSTGTTMRVTDSGTIPELQLNEDGFWEQWKRYGDDGYYQFKVYDAFTDIAEEVIEGHFGEVTWT